MKASLHKSHSQMQQHPNETSSRVWPDTQHVLYIMATQGKLLRWLESSDQSSQRCSDKGTDGEKCCDENDLSDLSSDDNKIDDSHDGEDDWPELLPSKKSRQGGTQLEEMCDSFGQQDTMLSSDQMSNPTTITLKDLPLRNFWTKL